MTLRRALASAMLLVVTSCLPAVEAEQHDLSGLSISNDPADSVAETVGVKGLPAFDPDRRYAIVLSPTLTSTSPTGVLIPRNIREAVAELQVALPLSYQSGLRFREGRDQFAEPMVTCSANDWKRDRLVLAWMVVYWKLRDPESPLVSFFRENVGANYRGEAIATEVKDYLCGALHAARNNEPD